MPALACLDILSSSICGCHAGWQTGIRPRTRSRPGIGTADVAVAVAAATGIGCISKSGLQAEGTCNRCVKPAAGRRLETGAGSREPGATSRMPASKRLLLNSPILGIPNDLPSAWLASSFHLPWAGVDSSGVCSARGEGHRCGWGNRVY